MNNLLKFNQRGKILLAVSSSAVLLLGASAVQAAACQDRQGKYIPTTHEGSPLPHFNLSISAPYNGAVYQAPYGGKATVTFAGTSSFHTAYSSYYWFDDECARFVFNPKISLNISGGNPSSNNGDGGFVASRPWTGVATTGFNTTYSLGPGTYTAQLEASYEFTQAQNRGTQSMPSWSYVQHPKKTFFSNAVTFTVTEASPPPPPPPVIPKKGPIIGNIDSVTTNSDGTATVNGWACDKKVPESIEIHLYAGGPLPGGTMLHSTMANLTGESALAGACETNSTAYRWNINLGQWQQQWVGHPIYVYGISKSGGANLPIPGSGKFAFPSIVKPATCTLSGPSYVTRGHSYSYTASGTNIPPTAIGYFFGTKNGVPDAANEYGGYLPLKSTHRSPSDGSWAGTYVRYLVIKNGSETICTTNPVTITLE